MWYPEQEGTRVPSSDSSLLISSDHPSKGFTVHQHIPQEYSTHSDAESMHDSRIEGDQLAALGFSICPSMAPTESSEETPQSTPTAVSVQPSHTPATSAPSKRSFQHPPDPPSISPSQHNIILPFQTANSSSTFSHSSSLIDPDANIPRLTSKPGSSPVLRPESVSETPGVTPGGTTSLNQAPSLIARISIPESHRKLFVETLSRPPDPALKVKKKSVRFKAALSGSTASVAASKVLRSNQESPVATSTTRLPSSISPKSGSSRPLCSSSPIAHHTSKLYGLPVMDSRDPDEKMAELMELKQVKIRQGDFLHLKDQIFQISQNLEEKESILDEVRGERKALQSELSRYIAMIKQVQKDFEFAQQAEQDLIKERDQLSQHLSQIKHHDYKILKEEVDQLRSKKGLRPLPNLEQEEAELMGRYLEQRRGRWREDGLHDSNDHSPFSEGSSSHAGSPSPARSSSSSSYLQHTAHASASSSSLAPAASSSTPTSRSRDSGSSRSRKIRQPSPGPSRSHSRSASKSRQESSNRTSASGSNNGTGRSSPSSRPVRQNHSRNQSPAPSSFASESRAERSKKRSRH